MLDGWHDGQRVGSGTVIWHARNLMAAGKLDYEAFMTLATASSPSVGHCNTGHGAVDELAGRGAGHVAPTCASIPRPTASAARWPTPPASASATCARICGRRAS